MHETDRFILAYDTRFNVKQIVARNPNQAKQTAASKWSLQMTGSDDIGNLDLVSERICAIADRFIRVFKEAKANR
jgi:hypothetical protein